MGRAIMGGLLASGYDQALLEIVDPDPVAQELVNRELGITVTPALIELADGDIVLLAVKPQVMRGVVTELARYCVGIRPLFISIAAGITTSQLASWLAADVPIVRVMPNTPALVGAGAAALFATDNVNVNEHQAAESIIGAVGLALWVENEDLLDVVTALSGSGPAYFFLIMELLEQISVELGLERSLARRLAIETAHGAALLARGSADAPEALRQQVTSPGGTTERALEVLSSGNIAGLLRNALNAAHQRSRELAETSEQKQ